MYCAFCSYPIRKDMETLACGHSYHKQCFSGVCNVCKRKKTKERHTKIIPYTQDQNNERTILFMMKYENTKT